MKITNNAGLPEAMYNNIVADFTHRPYKELEEEGVIVIRVSNLINPPLIHTLWETYKDTDELVVEAGDSLHMMFGTACHKLMEGPDTETIKHEVQLSAMFTVNGQKVLVVGTTDEVEQLVEAWKISDNKTCVVSSSVFDDKESYVEQLNDYAYLSGLMDDPDRGMLLLLRYYVKDFSPKNVGSQVFGRPYPEAAYLESPVPVWPKQVIEDKIVSRIKDHLENPNRVCTPQERNFGTMPKIVVAKKGNSGWRKISKSPDFNTEEEAEAFSQQQDGNTRVEIRGDIRCKFYCRSKSVCPYAKSKGYR